jgi:hypothetical protein
MSTTLSLINQSDVEAFTGVVRFAQLTSDTGGAADPTIFMPWLRAASERARGILMTAGWNQAQIEALVAGDVDARLHIAMIAAGFIGARKDEFKQADGSFPYSRAMKNGEDLIREKAQSKVRSSTEELDAKVGENPRLKSHTIGTGKKYFNRGNRRDPNDQGPGGF